VGAGALTGAMVGLGVHPFIITLGTMWILARVAFTPARARERSSCPSR